MKAFPDSHRPGCQDTEPSKRNDTERGARDEVHDHPVHAAGVGGLADGGHGLWVGKHELANCHMRSGRCRSNVDYGPDVPPGLPFYRGVEYYFYGFDLPAAATDVRLSSSSLGADDRMVLRVNGHEIGGFSGRATSPTTGIMEDASGRVTQHFFRNPVQDPLFLDDPSLFLPGQHNVLTFWVNNTGSTNFSAPAQPHGWDDISRIAYEIPCRPQWP